VAEKVRVTKTGDFEADVRAGYYDQEANDLWMARQFLSINKDHTHLRDDIRKYFRKLNEDNPNPPDPPAPETLPDTWAEDFEQWLLDNDVPNKYVRKVAYKAYERGHSGGYSEVLNSAYDLVEIFHG
jgi:hypothetical protein